MKILFVNNIGTMHGGTEIMIAQLRRELEKKGHMVRILAGDEASNGKTIADWRFKTFSDNSILKFLYIYNPFAIWKLWVTLRQFRPDIVHMHNVSKASPLIFLVARRYPTILSIHDYTAFDPTRFKDITTLAPYDKTLSGYFTNTPSPRFYLEKVRFWLYRRYCKSIDLVLACSDFYCLCAKQSKLFTRVVTLHDGIVLTKTKPIQKWHHLLFVGRLEEIKGADILLRALPKILIKNPKLHLYIVGSGPQMSYLKKLTEELRIGNMVKFLGFQSHRQIMSLYYKTTLVVIPSLCPESFGLVGIEAFGSGRPVIATRVGGIPEWLDDGKTGFLVEPGNSEQIAEKVTQLLSDRKLLQQMGKNARKKAEQYSIKIHADEIEKKYKLFFHPYVKGFPKYKEKDYKKHHAEIGME
ncbi:MAG: glycosyltransferase family 4 protein [Candidatus Microgenomates bacterium]|jgi:glycosyltransferase involved in cell wall biosynthesis